MRKEVSVLGPVAGVLGCMQATEAIKLLTGKGETLASKLLVVDMECNSFEVVEIERDQRCPVCSN
jgi:adenylyltransferase/sulfurtransferase